MRVTQRMLTTSVQLNLRTTAERLAELQNAISSGKRISKPSDDPVGISEILSYRKEIADFGQFERNINDGRAWLGFTDSALQGVDQALIRAKELAVYHASETGDETTRSIAASEVEQILESVLDLANSKLGKEYIFAGYQTDTAPFTRDDQFTVSYGGDDGVKEISVGQGSRTVVNIDGEAAFTDGVNVFDILRDLKTALEQNDTDAISAQIPQLDEALEQTLTARASTGARLERLELTENHIAALRLHLESTLSMLEDTDIVQAITDLASQEAVYEAALAAAARVIQPGLVRFLG